MTDTAARSNPVVALQRVYLKDCSLEVPHAPQVFARPWTPKVDVQVTTSVAPLEQDQFNVTLTVTVTATLEQDVAFLAEVHQAGVFTVGGFARPEDRQAVLGGHCPAILFPFARAAVASLVQHAGFPLLLLQPINFEAIYLEHARRAQQQAGDGGGAAPGAVKH